jgi:chemotaxis protein MotA
MGWRKRLDKNTVFGLVLGLVCVVGGILVGGVPWDQLEINAGLFQSKYDMFMDIPSIIIVFGCTTAGILLGYPLTHLIDATKSLRKVLFAEQLRFDVVVSDLMALSSRARREGLLSLEEAADESTDDFLSRGLQMMVDGHEPTTIESVMYDEIGKLEERHRLSIGVYEQIGTYAPAMGMVGTLIGLVIMLKGMGTDVNAIGPAMAVAILTTFYGAIIANLLAIPIANKLKVQSNEEVAYKELIVQGLLSILAGENPRFMVERLNAMLPPKWRYVQDVS